MTLVYKIKQENISERGIADWVSRAQNLRTAMQNNYDESELKSESEELIQRKMYV